MATALSVRDLTRSFGEGEHVVHALRGISLDLPAGSFTAIMGPSGSGKSTLLSCLAGLDSPTSGTVTVEDDDVTGWSEARRTVLRRNRLGIVFQHFQLIPYLSAEQNVGLPVRLAGRRPDRRRVAALLDAVGLTGRGGHLPGELSGGQQQRVAIARALVNEPAVVLADEPTGALDSRSARSVLELLRGLVDRGGQTVLMVTHDPVAASYADRVVFLVDGAEAGRMTSPTADAVATQLAHLDDLTPRGVGMSGMTMLARRSLSHRKPAFLATFVAVFLSALMVGSFAQLAEIGLGDDVPAASQEALLVMGAVIGGWGAVLAVFAVSSTLSVAVRGRESEIGLLRTIGATPRQARRLLRREVFVVAVLAAAAGIALSWPTGALLLHAVRDAKMAADTVEFSFGASAAGATFLAVVGLSLLAAGIAGRRVTSGTARSALAASNDSAPRRSRWRTLGGGFLILYGVSAGLVTVLVTGDLDDPFAAMSTAGSAGLITAVGVAAFGTSILRALARPLTPVLGVAGVGGHLAALATRHRSHLLGPVFGAAAVFTATGTSVLMLVGIDNRTFVLPEGMVQSEVDTVFFLNNVVTGMIAVFCAVVLVNALLAVIADRRPEFAPGPAGGRHSRPGPCGGAHRDRPGLDARRDRRPGRLAGDRGVVLAGPRRGCRARRPAVAAGGDGSGRDRADGGRRELRGRPRRTPRALEVVAVA